MEPLKRDSALTFSRVVCLLYLAVYKKDLLVRGQFWLFFTCTNMAWPKWGTGVWCLFSLTANMTAPLSWWPLILHDLIHKHKNLSFMKYLGLCFSYICLYWLYQDRSTIRVENKSRAADSRAAFKLHNYMYFWRVALTNYHLLPSWVSPAHRQLQVANTID